MTARSGAVRHEVRGGQLLAALAVLAALGAGSADAQDNRGERGTAADQLALGPDVASRAGPPSGPPVADAALDAQTEAIAAVLRCPVCQGLSVAASPSESARNMKRQVRAMVAAGYDEEQILSYFEGAYGEFVRMVPKAEGFNLVVFAVPIAALLGGAWAVARAMRRRAEAPRDGIASAGGPAELDPYVAAIRAEVARDG